MHSGFLSGVAFSILLGTVARGRKLGELSVAGAAACGALAGMLIGLLPFVLGDTGGRPWALLATATIGSIALVSAAPAAVSLALAQRAERRDLLSAGAEAVVPIADSGLPSALLPETRARRVPRSNQ